MNKLLSLLSILLLVAFLNMRCGNAPTKTPVNSSSARDSSNDTSGPTSLMKTKAQLQSARDSSNDTSGPKKLKLNTPSAVPVQKNKKDS